ncbi:MAG: hypothetical protein RLZZ532_2353 [Cyanobacteriota bacterium]|jgi:hypothetical protein
MLMLLKSLIRLITEVIPADPNAAYFKLNDNLSNYKKIVTVCKSGKPYFMGWYIQPGGDWRFYLQFVTLKL